MTLRHTFPALLLIAILFISCDKNDNNHYFSYEKALPGYYSALYANSNNEILIFGHVGDGMDSVMSVLKTDMDGNPIWEKRYSFDYRIDPACVQMTEQGEYFVAANGVIYHDNSWWGNNILLMKFDDNGDTLFTRMLIKSKLLYVNNMVRSRSQGVLLLLWSNYGEPTELLDITAGGEILSRDSLSSIPRLYLIGEYMNGGRYLMYNAHHNHDSLSAIIMRMDLSGGPDTGYFLTRGGKMGVTIFNEQEGQVCWLWPAENSIGVITTDLQNNILGEDNYSIDQFFVGFEEIRQVAGSNYALGYSRNDFNADFKNCIIKFSSAGEMQRIYLTPEIETDYFNVHLAGLPNGRLAIVTQGNEECDRGGCSVLRIYQ